MLYVVSGHMRTGTSMMMHALEAGGLDTAYQQSRDVMKNRHADEHYDPNIGGLYELERKDYQEWGFPQKYDGKLIKALSMGVPSMSVMSGGIRVVFMRRDCEEIRQSFNAFFEGNMKPSNKIDERMEEVKERINNRKDVVSFHEFEYREVVENPQKHFAILKDAGWPIDVEKAIDVADPKYCRFKREILTEGI